MINDYVIISVESRKGGVGKTTAALSLARLLKENAWNVFFIDADMTGTNAMYAVDHSFWNKCVHIVNLNTHEETGIYKSNPANLVDLFEDYFLGGKGLPTFDQNEKAPYLSINHEKINLIGSDMIGDRRRSIIAKGDLSPNILFDELHVHWFLVYLQELCNNYINIFRSTHHLNKADKVNKTAIVIDNSPGYIGIAPNIHEWLTNIGPEQAKFLFVTSMDRQDILSCFNSLNQLHNVYTSKWNASKFFFSEDNKHIELDGVGSKFLIELSEVYNPISDETAIIDPKHSHSSPSYLDVIPNSFKEFAFYLENISPRDGNKYVNSPTKYQAIIINRVFTQYSKLLRIYIQNIIQNAVPDGGRDFGKFIDINRIEDLSIEYNDDLANQFIDKSKLPDRLVNKDELAALWKAFFEFREKNGKKIIIRLPSYESLQVSLQMKKLSLTNHILQLDKIVADAVHLFQTNEMGFLLPRIMDTWVLKNIIETFNDSLWNYLNSYIHNNIKIQISTISRSKYSKVARENFSKIIERIHNILSTLKLQVSEESFSILFPSLFTTIYYSGIYSTRNTPYVRMADEVFAIILWVESKQLTYKQLDVPLSSFLKTYRLNPNELESLEARYKGHFSRELFIQLYDSCTTAQARLIDAAKDVDFLMEVFATQIQKADSQNIWSSSISQIISKVIVNKTNSHQQGLEELSDINRRTDYLLGFYKTFESILEQWEIDI